MIDDVAEENAALYVLGALPPEEVVRFEARLSVDGDLRALVRELRESSAQMALTAEQFTPSAKIREKIFESSRTRHAPSRYSNWIPWAIAAGLAIVATFAMFERQTLTRALADVRLEDNISKLRTAALSPQGETAPNTIGAVAWDPAQQKGVVTISKLPPLEPNQDYQMWVIDPQQKKPISGGIVQVDENGTAKLVFTVTVPIRSADAFAVSRERKGGASSPDGPIILMGR
jgi:anti-sigma-K factor RskA